MSLGNGGVCFRDVCLDMCLFLFTELCRFSGSFMIDDNMWRRFGVTGSCSNKGILFMVLDESWDKDMSDCGEIDLE